MILLNEVSKVAKFVETENRMGVARVQAKEKWNLCVGLKA